MNAPVRDRQYAVERVKHWLQRHSSPRLQMSMMLFATALAGFFVHFIQQFSPEVNSIGDLLQ